MEVVALVALAVVVLVLGIRVGMLVAPRVERMTDRLAREAPSGTPETTTTEPGGPPTEATDWGDA